jgi:6-phosphogluconolactonase (cycloisomerase 2 family)
MNKYNGFNNYPNYPSGGGSGAGINSINSNTNSAQYIISGPGISIDSSIAGTTKIINTGSIASLPSGKIYVGDTSNLPVPRTPYGELTMDDLGNFTLDNDSIINKILNGLIEDNGRVLESDTLLQALSKLSGAPTMTALILSSNGDVLVMGTGSNKVSINIEGVTGNNIVNFPGGGVTSTTVVGNNTPTAGTALSNITSGGIQQFVTIIDQILSGLSLTNVEIVDGDTIIEAFGKTQGQINALSASSLSNTLLSGQMFLGNGSNIATGVTPSGAWTINNAGVSVLSSGIDPLLLSPNTIDATTFGYLSGATSNLQMQINAIIAGKPFIGFYDASTNLFPSTGGTGPGGAIEKGNYWSASVAGTLGGQPVGIGAYILAGVNNPGQIASNWSINANGVNAFNNRQGNVIPTAGDYTVAQVTGAAPLASPTFTGTPAAPTPGAADSSTTLATTASILAKTLGGLSFTAGVSTGNLTSSISILTAFNRLAAINPAAYVLSTTQTIGVNKIFTICTDSPGLTYTLPSSNMLPYHIYTIKLQLDLGVTSATIAVQSGDTLDGIFDGTFQLTTDISSVSLRPGGSDGGWWIVGMQINNSALVPSQTGQAGKFLSTDGTNSSWVATTNSLALTNRSLVSTVNGVASSGVSVCPSPQSITSSFTLTNLDEKLILVAPLINAIGVYEIQLTGANNQQLNIVFNITANAASSYNYSTINIMNVNDSTGTITSANLSNYILFKGYLRTTASNTYFAVTMIMPGTIPYTNPVTLTAWQSSAAFLNDNSTITAFVTTDVSNLISLAPADNIFKMKVNVVSSSVASPQGYFYVPGSGSNAIYQNSITSGTGAGVALSPASVAMTGVYKLAATSTRNYLYAINNSNVFLWAISSTAGTISPLSPASFATTNTPTGIVVCPANRFVYVCGFGTGLFGQYSITKSTGQLVAIASAPTAAAGMQDLTCHPSGKWLYAINNINGLVYQYVANSSTGALTALGTPTIAAGSSPIKIVAHPSGSFVYVLNNGASTISVFSVNPSTGQLTLTSTFPSASTGNMQGMCISNNGQFIYYSSQTSNTINQSIIDTSTGAINTPTTSLTVAGARDCCIDYTGSFLYVINNTANQVHSFTINQTTGAMTPVNTVATGTNVNNIIAI